VKSTKFNWECVHCGKRNIETMGFQFDIPKSYFATWPCDKCGKDTQISFLFTTDIPDNRKEGK